MSSIYPHQMFQADFWSMLEVIHRQEELDPKYQNETSKGKEIFYFFAEDVMPLILNDDWVFNAAKIFVEKYAEEYFIMLRLLGSVYDTQEKLSVLRTEAIDLLQEAKKHGLLSGKIDLVKISDFSKIVDYKKFPNELKTRSDNLIEQSKDLEYLYVNVASRAIQSMYEKGLSRVFFVVKRALKIIHKANPTKADNKLQETHQYLNWCKQNLVPNHIIIKLFVDHKSFYKMTRNVDSHVHGPKWLPETNEVYLPDKEDQDTVHINKFSQRYRYLMYFCEIGIRGILATFCDRERGSISNMVMDKYNKIYKDNKELTDSLCYYPISN